MRRKSLTYATSGVSVLRGDRLVDFIGPLAKKTLRPEVVASVGGFAALSRLPKGYRRPLLVVSTDGVGTKVLLAKEAKKLDTVGIDLVAMSVNDILTLGAQPFLFLDYYATGKLKISEGREIIKGVADGCRPAGCALVGGETAEMPGVYRSGDFDLAGFCVGIVDEGKIIDGSRVRPGDVVLGLPSSGIHSNGYSLVRAILKKGKLRASAKPKALGGKRVIDVLLSPTRIYVREILRALKTVDIKAMAHITGGGIEGNLPRVLPKNTVAVVDRALWKVPAIFKLLQEVGQVSDDEMFRTFNMGLGFMVVASSKSQKQALKALPGSRVVGRIIAGRGEATVEFSNLVIE